MTQMYHLQIKLRTKNVYVTRSQLDFFLKYVRISRFIKAALD